VNKTCLLAAVWVFALSAQGSIGAERYATNSSGDLGSGHAPKGATILYNQNSNDAGWGVDAQNSTSGATGSEAADDFVVPKKSHWTVTEVDVTGFFYNGSGGETENVIFYQDDHGLPGKTVKNGIFTKVSGDDQNNGSFAIQLPGHGLSLKPGHYWVSVAVNCSYLNGCGQWNWEASSAIHGDQAVFEDPGANGSCRTWATLETCFGTSGDLMFDLWGTAKR
jgi:hypothetical protein